MTNNNILVIGDVHGKLKEYQKIVDKHNGLSIQVGDFGFKKEHSWHLQNIDSIHNKVCFGNHDDYTFLLKPHSLGDFNNDFFPDTMTIRGAKSIDRIYRKENIDWWANEEMNMVEMQNAVDVYEIKKPKIVISHECPNIVKRDIFGIMEKSITSNGFQMMFELHPPDLWIFGHHHKSINTMIGGTNFICLKELETFII